MSGVFCLTHIFTGIVWVYLTSTLHLLVLNRNCTRKKLNLPSSQLLAELMMLTTLIQNSHPRRLKVCGLFGQLSVNEWVSEWASEWGREGGREWVREREREWERVSEWVSEWVRDRASERAREGGREGASEWVSQWVSEWVSKQVSKRVREWDDLVSQSINQWNASPCTN